MTLVPFETLSVHMDRKWLVTVFAPEEDVVRIRDTIRTVDPLAQGDRYDSNVYQSAPGVEHYRPLDGAAAGPETDVRQRPGVVSITLEIDENSETLQALVEAVFQVHSYQEPVIRVQEILTSRSKGMDDRDNPHRWWNTTGDWKSRTPA
ncbi:MAG: hypothetical protein AAGF59_05830 [Pseudomonadota bacterium]